MFTCQLLLLWNVENIENNYSFKMMWKHQMFQKSKKDEFEKSKFLWLYERQSFVYFYVSERL